VYATLIYVSRVGERVRNPRCHGDQVFFEVRSNVTRVLRLRGGELRDRLLPRAHPTSSLLAADGDELLYLTADSTLTILSFEGGHVQPLRTLAPTPNAIAVTPETVVWCSAATGDSHGEIWRWWRDTDRVERLGTHDSARPLLAVRPVPLPFPPERITTDIAIAVDRQLGLIDVEGVDWIATVDESILQLACMEAAIVCNTADGRVIRCDLDSERCHGVFELLGPPRALVTTDDDRVIVAHDGVRIVQDDGQIVSEPPANIYEIDGDSLRRAAVLDDPTWVRNAMYLAAGPEGAILVEEGQARDNIDRVTYLPYDWRAINWEETLQIQRWVADGRGTHLMIESDRWWGGMAEGALDRPLFRAINEWLASAPPIVHPPSVFRRGWRISMGDTQWYCANDDLTSQQAISIARLIRLLTPHIPPLAFAARLGALG
jgi:hypothetical protein